MTTALLTDCRGMGEHEMSILKTNESHNECPSTTNGVGDTLMVINHASGKPQNEEMYNQGKCQNGLNNQDKLVNVSTTGIYSHNWTEMLIKFNIT